MQYFLVYAVIQTQLVSLTYCLRREYWLDCSPVRDHRPKKSKPYTKKVVALEESLDTRGEIFSHIFYAVFARNNVLNAVTICNIYK